MMGKAEDSVQKKTLVIKEERPMGEVTRRTGEGERGIGGQTCYKML